MMKLMMGSCLTWTSDTDFHTFYWCAVYKYSQQQSLS